MSSWRKSWRKSAAGGQFFAKIMDQRKFYRWSASNHIIYAAKEDRKLMKNYHVLVTCGYIALLAMILSVLRAPGALRIGLLLIAVIWIVAILRRTHTEPKS